MVSARLSELFANALQRPSEERGAYLQEACKDSAQRRELDSLLRAFLEDSPLNLPRVREQVDLESILSYLADPIYRSGAYHGEAKPLGKAPFFWLALLLGLLILGLVTLTCARIVHYGDTARWLGWSSECSKDGCTISSVDNVGPAAGLLEPGDQILSLNGSTAAVGVQDFLFPFVPPHVLYRMSVLRASVLHEVRLTIDLRSEPGKQRRSFVFFILGVSFLVMAMFMGMGQPGRAVTRYGFFAGLCVSMRFLSASLVLYKGLGSTLDFGVARLLSLENPWHFALTYAFFGSMFAIGKLNPIWTWIRNALYATCFVCWIPWACVVGSGMIGPVGLTSLASKAFWVIRLYRLFFQTGWWNLLEVVFVVSTTALIVSGFRKDADPDHRKRAQWIVLAVIVGLGPFGLFSLASVLMGGMISQEVHVTASTSVNCFLIIIPICVTYAVVKHRALGIHIVVRRGLQYLLATRVFQVLLCVPVLGILLPLVLHPERGLSQAFHGSFIYVNALLALALGVSLYFRTRVRLWLDRRFFRSEVEREQLLCDVISSMKAVSTIDGAATLVTDCVTEALHPRSLHILHRTSRTQRMVLARSEGPPEDLISFLAHPRSAEAFQAESASAERSSSLKEDRLGTGVLAMPIRGRALVCGVLILGEKKAEEPYTNTDRRLLAAVADQLALAYENIWLIEHIERLESINGSTISREESAESLQECPICSRCFDDHQEFCPDDLAALKRIACVRRIIGDYRLERRIGEGGMGTVYLATDISLDRKVAVKLLRTHLLGHSDDMDHSDALQRFDREARAIGCLQHPNVVTIHGHGQFDCRFGAGRISRAYLVMEFIEGCTLRSVLQGDNRISRLMLATVMDQVLSGVSAAHHAGVLHRDIKPENILLGTDPTGTLVIKIVDFGLAKMLLSNPGGFATATGVRMGTVGYMAPEQSKAAKVDERADIFSLGVLLYELLTGRLPNWLMPSETVDPIEGLEDNRLRLLLSRCLALNPDDRINSVNSLRAELRCLLDGS